MAKEYYCNKCGKEMDMWDIQEDFSIQRNLGFGTRYDGETLSLRLCCDCMNKLIESCAVSPVTLTFP